MSPSRPTPSPRPPLAARRRMARAAARARLRARTHRAVRPALRDQDPTDHRRLGAVERLGLALAALLAAAAVHGGLIGGGALLGGLFPGDAAEEDRGPIAIEVRERPPEREKEEPAARIEVPEEPLVTPEVTEKPRPEPRTEPTRTEPPPRTETPPEAADRPPPRRVVGLALENTVEGEGGPRFGTGNSRAGQTARTAEDPDRVPPDGQPGGTAREPSPNKRATRIPTAGGKVILPKRKRPVVPAYPPALKAQGIEANVPVMVSIDTSGRVTEVKILKPSPYPELDEAARQAALSEQFEPATRDGTAIPYTLSYTYRFRIEEP